MYGFIDEYKRALREEVERLASNLVDGGVASYEDYKRIAGEIKGLRKAESRFTEVVRRYIDEGEQ